MPDIFGAPVGISTAEADQRAQELHQLSMAEGGIKLEEAKMALSQQKQMLRLMQGASFGGPGGGQPSGLGQSMDLGDDLYALSRMAMASGMPDKAREFATAGSTVKHQAAEIQKNQIEAAVKEANVVGATMEQVKDPQSWEMAKSMLLTQIKPSPGLTRVLQQPYNPQLVQSLIAQSQTIKDRALTDSARTRALANMAEVDERRLRGPLIEAQTDFYKRRDTALTRAGATQKIPSAGEIKAITDLMKDDYDMTDEHMRNLARPVAERMKDLMKNQRLTLSEASHRAYQEAKESGDFGGARKQRVLAGSGAAKPLPLPLTREGKVDKTKVRDNLWYNVKGIPRLLLDGQFYSQEELADRSDSDNADEPAENPDDTAPAEEPR